MDSDDRATCKLNHTPRTIPSQPNEHFNGVRVRYKGNKSNYSSTELPYDEKHLEDATYSCAMFTRFVVHSPTGFSSLWLSTCALVFNDLTYEPVPLEPLLYLFSSGGNAQDPRDRYAFLVVAICMRPCARLCRSAMLVTGQSVLRQL